MDSNGHGTHVAGIIAGSGAVSATVTNARGSINVATNGHFRGMASAAKLFVQSIGSGLGTLPDLTLQETVAKTNAFISNNSWTYAGNSSYSLASASYDAAVRDSLSGVTGSQPVLYVFAAGNSGGGSDSGLSGNPGSVFSPGTSKNVITVGAIELARDITNIVTKITKVVGGTNQFSTNTTTPWKDMTSSGNQVAGFSGRGNVGIGTEGDFGRFKPDVVAPGTFVISTRSTTWDEKAYYNPTNHHYTTFRNQVVNARDIHNYTIFLPDNAVGFSVSLYANDDSPSPFPDLPVGVRHDNYPYPLSTAEAVRTNGIAVPPDVAAGPGAFVGQNWYYTITNSSGEDISYNILTDVITTNDLGDYYVVLSNLNNSLTGTNLQPPHYYRYESGTSMSAAGVSGTLALMQQFFEQAMNVTNSPAMMKALYAEPNNICLAGLLRTKRGSCVSMPVIYLVMGQRLGMPVHLVTIGKHYFIRWEETGYRMNIEPTIVEKVSVSPDDSVYLEIEGVTREQLSGSDLRNLTSREVVGNLLFARSGYWATKGQKYVLQQRRDLSLARQLAPDDQGIKKTYEAVFKNVGDKPKPAASESNSKGNAL